jgi:hypothetical protein
MKGHPHDSSKFSAHEKMATVLGFDEAQGHSVSSFLRHHWYVFSDAWHGALVGLNWRLDWYLVVGWRSICSELFG